MRIRRLATALLAAPLLVAAQSPPQILVYYATAGYYHDSIPAAMSAIQQIGQNTSLFNATFSKDENLFTPAQLDPFKAIVFLSNSDQVLTSDGEAALTDWLTKGGSLVGLHAGTACLFNDTAFGVAMGSWFDYHPQIQNITFTRIADHPTVSMFSDRFVSYEEAYHFRSDPRSVNATVILSYDPSSVNDPQYGTRPYYQGTPPPIAWYREGQSVDLSNGTALNPPRMPGRTWMTSLGHTIEVWSDPTHLAHVEAGLRWALQHFTTNTSSSSASPSSAASSPSSASSASRTATSTAPSGSAAPAATLQTPSAASTLSPMLAPAFALLLLIAAMSIVPSSISI
ncbi:hypothetical protein NBRC10512_002193 [Rhodotorula toruloides]|uniref:RHTO0S02e10858g1_1 n=2 Tax=Rhodotorula toruloides TaxID=5286 RepID=A0A061AQV0_RHOTO|nr:glycosyl-hydrolase [Rhodotorula toruloides NP11]EMS23560.1 glycosyl-hydrolase [Rhodotorula toruloides NP11]CDR37106.1 RHTO0S02e10858g1_1 [Rhodotorula toruloides]